MFLVPVFSLAMATRSDPCRIWTHANNIAGSMKHPGSTATIKFLGNTTSDSGCRSLCSAASPPCLSWTYHHPDFPGEFRLGCYGRTDDHWHPKIVSDKDVSSQWMGPPPCPPQPPKPPPFVPGPRAAVAFSWDTVPVFFHTDNTTGPFTNDAIEWIANNFPMATIEKWQGAGSNHACSSANCCAETREADTLRRLKQARKNISTVLYLNSLLDFPQYALHQRFLAANKTYWATNRSKEWAWWLRNETTGVPLRIHGDGCTDMTMIDMRVAGARAAFVETCVNATKQMPHGVDGEWGWRGGFHFPAELT